MNTTVSFAKKCIRQKKNEKILAFERDKLGVSCSRVCANKKSGLYWLNGDGRNT